MDNQVSLKGVFNWVLKVVDYCFGFAKHRFVIGQKKKKPAPPSQPSDLKLQATSIWGHVFPRFMQFCCFWLEF